jgi:RecB family exonuclease
MPTSTPDRSLTSDLLRGAAWIFGVAAALSFWVGGRALHEFAGFDRIFGEMAGILLAISLGLIAFSLRGLAERIEDHDDGEPVSLELTDRKQTREPTDQ